mgnify:CR=1 FL=1
MVSANTAKKNYGYFRSDFQNDMNEIIIQQCFLRVEQDMDIGQIGCPILLVAQNAIMKFQFPAYIWKSCIKYIDTKTGVKCPEDFLRPS